MSSSNLSGAIILALHNSRKTGAVNESAPFGEFDQDKIENNVSNNQVEEPTLWIDDDYLYQCPDCDEYMTADEACDSPIKCPNCGHMVKLKFVGEIDDVDDVDECKNESKKCDDGECTDECDTKECDANECDIKKKRSTKECDTKEYDDPDDDSDDDDEDLEEIEIKVKDGQVIRFKKAAKKGFKRVDGKLVKMSATEKQARKKAGKKLKKIAKRKAHTAKANKQRQKSMRKREKLAKSKLTANYQLASLNIDESKVINTLNKSITVAFNEHTEYMPFTVNTIRSAIYNKNTDSLVLECDCTYEDGQPTAAKFTVDKVARQYVRSNLTESTGVFNFNRPISSRIVNDSIVLG